MEWIDEAIVLSARPHGESAAIVNLLTLEHGRHAGLVAGGQGRSSQPILQPGNKIKVKWRARLLDHLGNFSCDLITNHASSWLDNQEILSVIASACSVTEASLPERQPVSGIYASLATLFSLMDVDLWGPAYVKWEMGLLQALGFGMDLSQCAASGVAENLTYVSPRTGRAVSMEAGAPYHEKLFPLPSFLIGGGGWNDTDICQGLDLTGHFLSRHVFAHPHSRLLIAQAGDLPLARKRLAAYYRKNAEKTEAEVA